MKYSANLAICFAALTACAPDITQDNPELDGGGGSLRPIARFDLADQEKVPFPIFLVQRVDGATGELLGDLEIPGDGALYEQINSQTGFTQMPVITLDFSSDISTASIVAQQNLIFIGNEDTPEVEFEVDYDSTYNKLYIYPQRPLAPGADYAIVLTKSIRGLNHLPIQEDFYFHLTKFKEPLYDKKTGRVMSDLLLAQGASRDEAAQLESLRLAYGENFFGKGDVLQNVPFGYAKQDLAKTSGRKFKDVSDEEVVDHIAVAWAFRTATEDPTGELIRAAQSVAADPRLGAFAQGPTAPPVTAYEDLPYEFDDIAARNGFVMQASIKSVSFTGPDGTWLPTGGAAGIEKYQGKIFDLPAVIIYPEAATRPPYPVVIFQHGLSNCKDKAVLAVANTLVRHGFAVAGIDAVEHGARALTNTDTSNDTDPRGICDNVVGGRTVKSGESFISVDNILATQDGLRQTALDLVALRRALAASPDFSSVYFAGQSMGGVLGTLFLRIDPAVEVGVLNVPPAWLSRTVLQAPGFAADIHPLLAESLGVSDVTSETFVDNLAKVMPLLQGLLDKAEPLYYMRGMPKDKRILIQQVADDDVALPAGTTLLAVQGEIETYAADASGTPVSGRVLWKSNVHGLLIDPDDPDVEGEDALNADLSAAMQEQLALFLESGGESIKILP